jgi:hypothetical protein
MSSDINEIEIANTSQNYQDNDQKEFFDNHISLIEIKNVLNLDDKHTAKYLCNKYLTKVEIPDGYTKPSNTTIYMYIKKEVYEIKKNNDLILAYCITQTQAIEYLDLPNLYPGKNDRDLIYRFKKIVKDFKLESYKLIGRNKLGYFFKEQIEAIKTKISVECDSKIKEYFNNHITRQEVIKILKLNDKNVAKNVFGVYLTKVKIPEDYPKLFGSLNSMYDKNEVYKIKEYKDFILTNCITQAQTVEYLDLPGKYGSGNSRGFRKVIRDFQLKAYKLIGHSNVNYYIKEQIEAIKLKQKDFWEEHIATFEIKETYPFALKNRLAFFDGLEVIDIPPYARIKASSIGVQKAYKREGFLTTIESVIKKKQIYDTKGETYIDTFKKRLELILDEGTKFNLSIYTKEKWFQFAESKLKQTQSFKTSESKISQLISLTTNIINKALKEFDVSEIYSLSSKQLALVYKWAGSDAKTTLCYFLNKVDEDVKLQVMKTQSINKGFSLSEVNKIRVKEIEDFEKEKAQNSKKNDIEIYDFETYSKVFEFLSNIKYHIRNSINKILEDKDIKYPSVWLYLMLHLNNAWRHGDVTDFPRLHVYDLLSEFNITDLDWFLYNELTLEQSRRLIQRVINQEFRISKTQIKGCFFSSDVLAPSIASAILIIEVFLVSTGVLDSEVKYVPLLNFKTKYNEPTRERLRSFFKGMNNNGDFVFMSKKFNKSVMTFIYHLSNMAGDDNALKLVQQLRNHLDPNSPLDYVAFDLEKIEGLTKHLFMRGEFGYIPSLLIQRIQGKALSFQEMTEQVYLVNNVFNGVFKIQSTICFLNTVNHERALIMKMIEESSLEECEMFLTDIFTGNLPSREENIQCLISKKGCQRTDLKTCMGCPYHIPSIYALTTLCKAILNDINEFKVTKNLPKQMKIALSFNRKIVVLKEAIHQFGEEYVYSCIGLSETELADEMELIPESSEFYGELFQ